MQPDDNRFDRNFAEPPIWEARRSVLGGEPVCALYEPVALTLGPWQATARAALAGTSILLKTLQNFTAP